MRRLIFGCGYLGFRVAMRWRDRGDTVFALTRSSERAAQLNDAGILPLIGDVTQPEAFPAFPQCDTVLHAVGFDRQAAPTKSEVYVDGLRNVLDAVSGRCGHFLHVSSTSVYAQHDGETVDEDSPCQPVSEGGQICLKAEALIHAAVRQGQPGRATILRLSGIYGPQRLLARLDAIRQNKLLPGNPEAWLNLIHVDDTATAVMTAADSPPSRSLNVGVSTFLITDDRPVQRREYYERLAAQVGARSVRFDPSIDARHSHGSGKRCSNRRMHQLLQVQLQYPDITTGLPAAVNGD